MEKLVMLQSNLPPEEITQIEDAVRGYDFICSAYPEDILDPYSVRDYLCEKHVHGNEFQAVLDRNLMSSLTHAAREGEVCAEDERRAITLLDFFRIADIEIEPGVSLAEYADSYHAPNPSEELELFRKIDDIPNENLHALALNQTSKIAIAESAYQGETKIKSKFLRAEDLHQWQMAYGYALKMYLLHHDGLKKLDFLHSYIEWMWSDYALGGVALPFAAAFASEKHGRMLKGINSLKQDKVLKGLRNAAWDMTIVHYWTNFVVRRSIGDPFLIFCTADKGLKSVAARVATCEDSSVEKFTLELFADSVGESDAVKLQALHNELDWSIDNPDRAVYAYRRDQFFFDSYIRGLEEQVVRGIGQRAQQGGDAKCD